MITVFTPVHKLEADFLLQAARSLEVQTNKDFEWLILLNGEAQLPHVEEEVRKIAPFARIEKTTRSGNIGFLKGMCCDLAKGDILVELDYDDFLTHDAIDVIAETFEDENVMFAYSNNVHFVGELRDENTTLFGEQYGWKSRKFGLWNEQISFPETAQYMRRIEWAPNHVRCFRKSGYDKVKYNTELGVGDDHDLVCRMYIEYGERGFKHIDKCLYFYRIHPNNTCNGANRNREIQKQVDVNYVNHAEPMYLRWAKDNNLLCLDLGGRFNCPAGYQSVDLLDADYIANLEETWPFEDSSVGVLRAYHILEHLEDPIHFFNEAYRVLAPGGFLLIEVPSVKGDGAFADPTHKKFFNLLSFEYYTNEQFARFIRPSYKGKFQVARLVEYWWSNPKVPVISAQLIALKGWYDTRWCGERKI